MSIEYDHSESVMFLDCDYCASASESYDGDDWHEALAAAKADGWRTFKDNNGDWCVKCPDCVGYGVRPEEED